MAKMTEATFPVRFVPCDETMKVVLGLLDLWQDANPDKMVAMVPQKDRYVYEIISRETKKNPDCEGCTPERGDCQLCKAR